MFCDSRRGRFALKARLAEDPLTRAVPVLALSANAAFADIRRGRAAGFLAYLTKPLQIPALVEALSRALTLDVEPRSDVDAA